MKKAGKTSSARIPSARSPSARSPSARSLALDILERVLDRREALDEILAQIRDLDRLDPRDRHFVRALIGATLRHLGEIDHVIGACLERPLPARAGLVRRILRLGVAQILFLETPAHAAVDSMVELTATVGAPGFKGLVNAVLRRIAREAGAFRESARAIRNLPDWLWQGWLKAYGLQAAEAILAQHRFPPPLDFALKRPVERDIWKERLDAKILPTGALRRPAVAEMTGNDRHRPILDLPGFAEGAWWIQDAAAQLPVLLLGDVAGKRVLDCCAAPGGKTAQLAASGAYVTALERSPRRLRRMEENLHRLDLEAKLECADAATWSGEDGFDAVLLDAPCSATGTIRRHPDIPWRKDRQDIMKLLAAQDRLLQAAIARARPGGLVLYATCSLEPEEGEERIDAFLRKEAGVLREPIGREEIFGFTDWLTKAGDLRTLPFFLGEYGGMDGFFAARLRKRK